MREEGKEGRGFRRQDVMAKEMRVYTNDAIGCNLAARSFPSRATDFWLGASRW